jgi:hypothetical protein
MSNFISTKVFAKISELDEAIQFDSDDEFVVVNDNITQKINGQYLTDSIVAIGNLASKAYVDAVVDGAPALLDTLNELAAALNDDENFATNIIASINTKLTASDFGLEFWSALEGVTTFHIAEDTNLYFTEQRVLDIIAAQPTNRLANGSFEVTLNANGTLTLPVDPTSDGHAATKGYVDSQFNSIESDRLINGSFEVTLNSTGTLTLPADPTSDGHAATKGYVDNQITDIVAGQGFATLDYVEDAIDTALDAVASQFTTENLNVKNIAFTGTGAVTIASGNDLNLTATGKINLNGELGNVTIICDEY